MLLTLLHGDMGKPVFSISNLNRDGMAKAHIDQSCRRR